MSHEILTPEALDTIEAEGFVITQTTFSDGFELWDGIIYQSLAAANDELPPPAPNPLYEGNCRVVALVSLSDLEAQQAELRRLRTENEEQRRKVATNRRHMNELAESNTALQVKINVALRDRRHDVSCLRYVVGDPAECSCWRAALTGEATT